MEEEDVPSRAASSGQRLTKSLAAVPGVAGVRGVGLLLAAELEDPGSAPVVAKRALAAGLVVNAVTDSALRLEPSLLVSDDEIDEAVEILSAVLAEGRT
jgi:acetylornithine aminotransferase